MVFLNQSVGLILGFFCIKLTDCVPLTSCYLLQVLRTVFKLITMFYFISSGLHHVDLKLKVLVV